jgi:ABC-type ATPase with predicted acetyltransferase domain
MIRVLACVFRERESVEVVECRHCGTTLESRAAEECPTCGSDEIACYSV